MSKVPNQRSGVPARGVAPGSVVRPGTPGGVNQQRPPGSPPMPPKKAPPPPPKPKPIGPAPMTPAQKAARDARQGPKLPAGPNEARQRAEVFGKGHEKARHIAITPHQMMDRLHGKDPGKATANPNNIKEVVTKYSTQSQANKAGRQVLASPQAQAALKAVAKQPVGTVSNKVSVTLKKPVTINVMRGPAPVKVGGKRVLPEGPPNFTTQQTRTVEFRAENTTKGPAIHTSFGVPKKP